MRVNLSYREANDAMLEVQKKDPDLHFYLIPVETVKAFPERPAVTPKIHFETNNGVNLGKHGKPPGPSSGMRRSGPSGSRSARPRPPPSVDAAAATGAGTKRPMPGESAQPVPQRRRVSVAPPRLAQPSNVTMKGELREAKKLIKELMSHRWAYPFKAPVDINAYPTYLASITRPMDLGTIQKFLNADKYETLQAFAEDLRVVWANCFSFNKDMSSDICKMALELERMSEERITNIPAILDAGKREVKEKEADDINSLKKQLKAQQKQMAEMMQMQLNQQQLAMGNMAAGGMPVMPGMPGMPGMHQAQQGGGNSRSKKKGGGGGGGGRAAPRSNAMVAFGDSSDGAIVPVADRGDMTFDQRAAISAGVAKLNANNLSKIVSIIQENMPSLGSGEKEIEVDVNALDNSTLWRLWDYLENCKAHRPKKQAKQTKGNASWMDNYQAAQARTDQQLSLVQQARSSIGGGGGGTSSGAGMADPDDDWNSDGDSDGGLGGGGTAGGGGNMWQGFQQAKQSKEKEADARRQRERQQQEAARNETQRARQSAAERAAQAQKERDAQRQAEREARQRERTGGIDMMAQQNAMADFQEGGDDDDWDNFDEFGGF